MGIEGKPPYLNRIDAGRVLAQGLKQERNGDAVVFAIPRGGVPVAVEVVAPVVSSVYPFAVAGFYRHWHDLTDEEVLGELDRYANADRRNAHDA